MKHTRRRTRTHIRHGFTLVELIVSGMVAALVLGAITMALFQSSRARETTATRLAACTRASAALDLVRREVASIMRRSDLFETRVLLFDDRITTTEGDFDRDELLVFNTSLRPTRPNEYSGEGQEYESHFRVGEDRTGLVLWQRRDPVIDEWDDAGGIATPVVVGIVSIGLEAYDGENWFEEWDSDLDGLPWAIRITVTASGYDPTAKFIEDQNPYEEPQHFVTLRTQVSIDRIVPPPPPPPEPEEGSEDGAEEEAEAEAAGVSSSGSGGGRRPDGMGRPGPGGMDRPGGDRPGPGRGGRGGRTNGGGRGGQGGGGRGGGGVPIGTGDNRP